MQEPLCASQPFIRSVPPPDDDTKNNITKKKQKKREGEPKEKCHSHVCPEILRVQTRMNPNKIIRPTLNHSVRLACASSGIKHARSSKM